MFGARPTLSVTDCPQIIPPFTGSARTCSQIPPPFLDSAKTCDNDKVYQPNVMTNCPLTCGMSAKSYFAQSCKTDGHAGCECPAGLFKQNGICVEADACQCKGDDQKYYNKGNVIRSSDNCLEW